MEKVCKFQLASPKTKIKEERERERERESERDGERGGEVKQVKTAIVSY